MVPSSPIVSCLILSSSHPSTCWSSIASTKSPTRTCPLFAAAKPCARKRARRHPHLIKRYTPVVPLRPQMPMHARTQPHAVKLTCLHACNIFTTKAMCAYPLILSSTNAFFRYRNDILHVRQPLGLCASVQENPQPNFFDRDNLYRRGDPNNTLNRDFNHTILVHNAVLCWDLCTATSAYGRANRDEHVCVNAVRAQGSI